MAHAQHGPDEAQVCACHAEWLHFPHAFESVGAAEKIPQDGFSLIIGVMGKQKSVAAVRPCALRKKFMAGVAGGGLHRFRPRGHALAHLDTPGFTIEPEFPGQSPDETRIFGGCPASQAVIKVADDKLGKPLACQQMKQGHRIRPTGYADKVALGTARPGKPWNLLL